MHKVIGSATPRQREEYRDGQTGRFANLHAIYGSCLRQIESVYSFGFARESRVDKTCMSFPTASMVNLYPFINT